MRLNRNNKFKILILSEFPSDNTEFKLIKELRPFNYNPENKGKLLILDDTNKYLKKHK